MHGTNKTSMHELTNNPLSTAEFTPQPLCEKLNIYHELGVGLAIVKLYFRHQFFTA
jgi:hypothetical protein